MLERNPSNDSRCLTFKVKDSYRKEFVSYFNSVYGKIYKLYDTKEAIERGFFGSTDKVSNRIDDFLADYVALSYTNYQLCSNPKSMGMKSSHAGITKEEMEVPLIVLKK